MSETASAEINPETKVAEYLKLFLAFRALPETKRRQTFMEISGYPHYENVCSNILSFYFDPTAEHGLKDLLLSSFLHVVGEGEIVIPENVTPEREYPAEDQQRIDLVINCDTFTLGIENKIYHWEANDFDSYARVIEGLGKNKKVIKAVLCLGKAENQEQLPGGFKRYTYCEFWQQVRARLGTYISHADPKWVTCLLDLMETTTNLAGNNMEHKKLDRFFIENNELIERMVTERVAFLTRLQQKVAQLMTMMKEAKEARELSGPPWVYRKSCLVLDFKFKDLYKIYFNLHLLLARPSDRAPGWELQLFCLEAKDRSYLEKIVKQPPLNTRLSGERVGERFMVEKWSIDADLGEIRDALRSWIRAVIAADTAEPS